jgi:putative solute:sodium symporter small subunit
MRADTSTVRDEGNNSQHARIQLPDRLEARWAMFDWNEYPWSKRPDLRRQLELHRLRNLLLVTLAGWVSYFLGINLAIIKLNKIIVPIINLPLGFYMAVQGSIVMFVIFLFWFAKNQRVVNGE